MHDHWMLSQIVQCLKDPISTAITLKIKVNQIDKNVTRSLEVNIIQSFKDLCNTAIAWKFNQSQ